MWQHWTQWAHCAAFSLSVFKTSSFHYRPLVAPSFPLFIFIFSVSSKFKSTTWSTLPFSQEDTRHSLQLTSLIRTHLLWFWPIRIRQERTLLGSHPILKILVFSSEPFIFSSIRRALFYFASSAVNENPIGALQSFTVDNSGVLTMVDTVSSGGDGPPFANPLSTGEVTAMNVSSDFFEHICSQ